MTSRIKNLIDFCQGIYRKENGKELYNKYLAEITTITPYEVIQIENEQLKMGLEPKEMLVYVDKLINVFYKSLRDYSWERPLEGTFLGVMMAENQGVLGILEDLKLILKKQEYTSTIPEMLDYIKELQGYEAHLLKLENILFPYMEKKDVTFEGLKIMWSLHDDVRADLKSLIKLMSEAEVDTSDMNVSLGRIFFAYHGMIQKQELILFPCATELMDESDFLDMLDQSFEYGFAYINAPVKKEKTNESFMTSLGSNVIHTATGNLTHEQAILLINTLPVDVTLVDENDKVAFFSRPKERIFPRSAAVIGRDVRNCHPPESVHVVEEILKDFKSGLRSETSFWIQMKGMFLLIQYYALRDDQGIYKGTLEVSQEISHIRSLEGEKRLLD